MIFSRRKPEPEKEPAYAQEGKSSHYKAVARTVLSRGVVLDHLLEDDRLEIEAFPALLRAR